jgi:ethanolamine-phosphate cytidylyltransferase
VLEKVYKVDVVVHGKTDILPDVDGNDPYALPKSLGIYREIETPFCSISTDTVIERIVQNRMQYEARNRRKQEKARIEEKLLLEERQKKAAIAVIHQGQK